LKFIIRNYILKILEIMDKYNDLYNFKDFKSLWIKGGFIECKAFIPFAMSFIIFILLFHVSLGDFFMCNISNKVPYSQNSIIKKRLLFFYDIPYKFTIF